MKENLEKRNISLDLDAFLELDRQYLDTQKALEDIKAQKNAFSKQLGALSPEEKTKKLQEMSEFSEKEAILREKFIQIEQEYFPILYRLPNDLDSTTAVWKDESENMVESTFGEKPVFSFGVQSHVEIAEKKWWIDTAKASEVSGARFWYLKGDIVLLQFAIIQYALGKLIEKGFSPILPPVLVREEAMFGTGFLPAGEDGVYRVNETDDDLYLVGTSEVPVTSYHAKETIDVSGPIKYVAYSECFRKEAGSAGKDMKGILRGHQFQKIEMVAFCAAEDSQKLHTEMVSVEEEIWQWLGIHYQKVNICSWDLGNPAMKKYDLEAWIPSQEKYREVTSCSNIGTYQSRRLGIRYKDADGKLQYAHTLNGTVIALSRCLLAIMENYQLENGDIRIPEVLQPYMWGRKTL